MFRLFYVVGLAAICLWLGMLWLSFRLSRLDVFTQQPRH